MTTEGNHAVITDEMIADTASRIGKVWVPKEPYFNTQATEDTIRHFVNGIGDINPLYQDPDYARKTRYGRMVAPPCFLYSVYWPRGSGGSMPGIHAWHSGNEWEWFKPILEGDRLTFSVTLSDVQEKESKFAGRIFIAYDDTVYKNQRNEVVAKAKGWATRAERASAGEKGKYKDIPKAKYTPEEVKVINESYDKEVIRGNNPRYWEDVRIGESLPSVVKGPLSVRDMNAWLMGSGSLYMKAHRIFYEYQKAHPSVGMIDSTTGIVDVPELVHMEDSRAGEIGVPGAYDYGCQRMSWLGHLLTNWVGDEGFVRRMNGQLRLFNVVGDTTWCKGKVTGKRVESDEFLVDIECWGENQRGETTMPGTATVSLPSREKGVWPLERLLPNPRT
ncbi:MaoC family dehydratase N-terminal domain-containing protein [Chloroflexota bacterium]